MNKLWLLLIIPALLLLWWIVEKRDTTPMVHVAAVERLLIRSTVPTNGKVEPVEWAIARAETDGVVRLVDVERGQTVKRDQILVSLDTQSAQANLAASLARQQEASAELKTTTAGGKAATVANIEDRIRSSQSSIEIAKRKYESLQRLLPQHAATQLQVDEAKDALDAAQLQLQAQQNQKTSLVTSGDRQVALAKLKDAEAGVLLARHTLSLATIKSPRTGTLYQFDTKVGAYLRPNDVVGSVGNLDEVKIVVNVDEPDLGRIALDMPVDITWDARPGKHWTGKIQKLPTQVVSVGTRTVGEATCIVGNADHELLPGVTVYVTVISAVRNNALAVPKQALRTVRNENGVYKLVGRRADWTPVKIGVSDINNVEILAGLAARDQVITSSESELVDRATVKVARN